MIAKIALIAVSPFVLMSVLLGATGVVLVDVRETGCDNMHLTIPVPLALAQVALTFAPDEAKYIRCPQFARYQEVTLKVLHELEKAPDGVLVEVHDGSDDVVIRKDGRLLRISVKSADGESVECALPIKGAIQAVRAYDGQGFPTKAALYALRHSPRGRTLVHVKDGSDEVHIRLL
jgi:hypothetical protein